ncbi:MAG: hypothetical protein IT373_31640, partial [Polyangiaceae bacterium]|nr:hypothetical protein [Polyangiaceae bacterium]
PLPSGTRPPWPGSPDATRLAAELRQKWLEKPASHVVDCTYWQPLRTCPRCRPGQLAARYVAYLPAALFTEPERVRALALLVPGGRGGRSRAFLSPIPNKTIWNMGSGGLRTKQLVDAYLAAHPASVAPIVVSLESRGTELNNGQTEHLSRDLPEHIAATYLGGVPLADLVLGAEGISSGGRAVMETLFDEPAAFHAVALTCMACGKLDPGRPFGFGPEVFDRWADALQARAAAGQFELRFTIGSRDGQKPCSSALYSIFGAHGLFDLARPPVYTNGQPGKPESEDSCDTERPGWVSYAGEMHHYGLLKKSWAPELEWLLGALERVRQRRAAAAP